MTISEVSEKYNIPSITLRYYEKIGLIETVIKTNGKRVYQQKDLERIEFIMCFKNAGLALKDILYFIELYNQGDSTILERIKFLSTKKESLKKDIEEKQKSLDYLDYKIKYYQEKQTKL